MASTSPLALVKQAIKTALPKAVHPSALVRMAAVRETRGEVVGGPFQGMRYVEKSIWGAFVPKLLGTYELELHPFVERALHTAPSHIVDIGGAEGYYAVGLLLRAPSAELTVFEQLEEGRACIADLARRNGVEERLKILGNCDPDALRACLARTRASLVLSDVEGYEVELLDPARVPELVSTTLLVEVHDRKVRGCRAIIEERFRETHEITRIEQRRRVVADYPRALPFGPIFAWAMLKYGLSEFRSPENGWLWLEPKVGSVGPT